MAEKKYSPEFKKESILLVIEKGYKAKKAAEAVGVPYNTLISWIREYKKYNESAFPGKGRLRPEDDEIRKLKKEIADLKEENAILKKATAIFARPQK